MYMTSKRREALAQKLFDKMIELKRGGERHIKKYEIAYQEVIEEVCKEKVWWEVTGCQIFQHLMENKDPEKTVIEILKQLKED